MNRTSRIVARIPTDNGRSFRCGGDLHVTVEPQTCEWCSEKPADVLFRGETDSFGWEPNFVCQPCVDGADRRACDYRSASDVEDRAPKEGHTFMVSECTNYDGHGDWLFTTDSFRAAVGYLRTIRERAAPWGGLYPDNGVQEVTLARANAANAAKRAEQEYPEEQQAAFDEEFPDRDEAWDEN